MPGTGVPRQLRLGLTKNVRTMREHAFSTFPEIIDLGLSVLGYFHAHQNAQNERPTFPENALEEFCSGGMEKAKKP